MSDNTHVTCKQFLTFIATNFVNSDTAKLVKEGFDHLKTEEGLAYLDKLKELQDYSRKIQELDGKLTEKDIRKTESNF